MPALTVWSAFKSETEMRLSNANTRWGVSCDGMPAGWLKPQRPEWLDPELYDRLPDTLTAREMKFAVREHGFRMPAAG